MADKRITDLTPITATDLDAANDVLAVADVSAAETKKLSVADAIAASANSLPGNTIDGSVIIDNSIEGAKLEANSVTTRELAPNACFTENYLDQSVTQQKLANGSVGTDQLINGSITGDKLSPDAISDAAISDRSLDGVKLKLNTLTQDELGPDCVGASELADASVDTPAIIDGVITTPKYQNASVTDEKLANGIDGGKLSNGSVDTNQLADGSVTSDKLAGDIPVSKLPDATAGTVLAGPASGPAASPTFRALVPSDIPTATSTTKGGVSIPAGSGLSVDGNGATKIDNTVVAGGFPFVNFNSHGLITSGRALSGSDLPPPALGQPGAVKPGTGLEVTADGTLNVLPPTGGDIGGVKTGNGINIAADGTVSQSLTGIAPGTYTKLTVDNMGNATAGGALEASDIPTLDLNQIGGEISTGQLADKSVTRAKLANYAQSFIQEARPNIDASVPIGQFWFQESTATLSQWNGNSWLSVGQGRLSAENLRYCGTVNAATNSIDGLTQFGTGEGFKIGDSIEAASDEFTGVYFIVSTAGDQINVANVNGTMFDAGDWIICNGAANGWVRIDTASGGGGGGGGASNLNDLLDVNIGTATEGALLQLMANGQWQDVYAIDAGEY